MKPNIFIFSASKKMVAYGLQSGYWKGEYLILNFA